MNETAHELVEMMASTWDQNGHRAPSNWRYVCTCGASERGLRGQEEASDAWQRHRAAVRMVQAGVCSLCRKGVYRCGGLFSSPAVLSDGSRHAHGRPFLIVAAAEVQP